MLPLLKRKTTHPYTLQKQLIYSVIKQRVNENNDKFETESERCFKSDVNLLHLKRNVTHLRGASVSIFLKIKS